MALTVAEGSFIIQAHALNTSNEAKTIEAWINLETVDSAIPVTWLSLSAGHTMNVPAHSSQTIKASASEFNTGKILQLVGHFHSHTTEERVSYNGNEIYHSSNWQEPDVEWFRPTLDVPIGGTFAWECDIDNTTDKPLRFANEVYTAEMCNLVGFIVGTKPWAASLP